MDDWDDWVAESFEPRRAVPASEWVPIALAVVAIVVLVDAATFYGLFLLGRALHDAIFG